MKCERTIDLVKGVDISFVKGENCVVDWAKSLLLAVRKEICGKCVFCREGTSQLHKIISDISDGKGQPEDMELIQEICTSVAEQSDCELSKSAVKSIAASMSDFSDEWEAHIKRKKCAALICRKLVTYHILGEKCTGCTQCLGKCPESAIEGEEGMIHVIDQDLCTHCGICFDICNNVSCAIVKAGPVKPQTPDSPIPVGTWQPKGLGLRKGLGLKRP